MAIPTLQHHHYELDNGLTIIGEHQPAARTMAAGFFVRTGARDEAPEVSGVSHFLEHMMFKGTARRSPRDVNREFDAMGARYNAFTSDENTVYYGYVLSRFQPRLLDLLVDMMRPALRDEDFDIEKNVILEEIAMYHDRPQFQASDLARATYYGAHPMGASVRGSAQSVRDLRRDQMVEYFSRRYAANNLTLVFTGRYDRDSALAQVAESCGGWQTVEAPRALTGHTPRPTVKAVPSEKFKRAHIYLLAPGLAAQDRRRYAAAVACEAIGAGDASRLYWALVHPGMAQKVVLGHDASDGIGAYYGYLVTDPERAIVALAVLHQVVQQACRQGLNEAEVERAKRRMASRMVLGAETPMGRLRPVGMDWVYRREQKSPDATLRLVRAVTVSEVNRVLTDEPFERATVVALGSVGSAALAPGPDQGGNAWPEDEVARMRSWPPSLQHR